MMKMPSKFTLVLVGIPLAIMLSIASYFSSNIHGYFRFQHYCSSEGGLRVFEPLEKNVGWWAKDYNDAHVAAQLKYVAFARYKDEKDGVTYDLRYLGGDPQYDKAFEKIPADESKPLIYKWRYVAEDVPNELRLGRSGYEVLDFKNERILARFHMFGYSAFDPSNTILGAPSGIGCFHEGGATFYDLPRSLTEIITAFKN
jgi:hypothetical protein